MKSCLNLLIPVAVLAVSAASVAGPPPQPESAEAHSSGMGVGQPFTLMKAVKSPDAILLADRDETEEISGAYIIIVQSRDGVTTVADVEDLDTVYLLAAKPGQPTPQTIEFETAKASAGLYLLRYQLVNDMWAETAVFDPADLPNIDFAKAYADVQSIAGQDIEIASIGVFYPLVSDYSDLVVSFQVLRDMAPYCEQWQYHVIGSEAGKVFQTALETKCFFEMSTNYNDYGMP